MKSSIDSTVSRHPGTDRRSFLKGAGLAGLGIAGASMLAPATAQAQASGLTNYDVAVLNFALNLEYLEAEFYTQATYGKYLDQVGIGTGGTVGNYGPTTGGNRVIFEIEKGGYFGIQLEQSGKLRQVAQQITYDEQTHVTLLRSILGPLAVAKPRINLDALGTGYANFKQFLNLARSFEDTGVSAYGGAVGLLSSVTLGTAARIALTEAYHASSLRLLCATNAAPSAALDSLDFPPPPAGTKFFDVDAQGLALTRTTSQVLAIVYANATPGTTQGGFFPEGVNGAINTV